jgi:hypothetical protein
MTARDPHRPSTGLIVSGLIGLILWLTAAVIGLAIFGEGL